VRHVRTVRSKGVYGLPNVHAQPADGYGDRKRRLGRNCGAFSISRLAFDKRVADNTNNVDYHFAHCSETEDGEMRFVRTLSACVLVGIGLSILAGCVNAPPAPPPRPMTKEEIHAVMQDKIDNAVGLAALAGHDPGIVRMSLNYNWCLSDAQNLRDSAQRSAAFAQCRVDYPQPAVAPPPVRTSCYSSGGVTQCTSQ
jgi:hypothetical protein